MGPTVSSRKLSAGYASFVTNDSLFIRSPCNKSVSQKNAVEIEPVSSGYVEEHVRISVSF